MAHLASHIQNYEIRFLPSSLTLAQIGRIFEWNCSPWPAATPRPSCLGRLSWTHHKRERKRDGFLHSISPGRLAGDRMGVVPASGFSFSAQQIWKVIKENKDLDLPAHKVMVATVRCEEIANQKFKQLVHDEKKLSSSLSGPVEALLETGAKDTWASIRKLLNRETKVAVSEFSTAVANFELDNETVVKMKQHLKDYARNWWRKKQEKRLGKL